MGMCRFDQLSGTRTKTDAPRSRLRGASSPGMLVSPPPNPARIFNYICSCLCPTVVRGRCFPWPHLRGLLRGLGMILFPVHTLPGNAFPLLPYAKHGPVLMRANVPPFSRRV